MAVAGVHGKTLAMEKGHAAHAAGAPRFSRKELTNDGRS